MQWTWVCSELQSYGENGCTFLVFITTEDFVWKDAPLATHDADNCDIADGTEYNKLNINFPHSSSLTCNAEGIAVFSSSNSTLWSVYFTIKELPVILRHIHTILNALWTGKCKPQKDTLLHCLRKSLPQWKICLTLVFIGPRMLQFSTPRFTSAFFLATVLHVHCCKTNQFNGGVWLRVVSESGIHDKQRTWSSSCLYSKVWREPQWTNTYKYCRSCITVIGGRKMHFALKVSTGWWSRRLIFITRLSHVKTVSVLARLLYYWTLN